MNDIKIETSWKNVLQQEFAKTYFSSLIDFVKSEYQTYVCYPKGNQIFEAFSKTPFDKVKVVILGQDPYHGPGQAHGLCFSVPNGVPFPPSLANIFKEMKNDIGKDRTNSDLTDWAAQGVLLLNATLTVRANQAGSHQKKGWETFTDAVIKKVSDEQEGVIFILWGAYAQQKTVLIDETKHLVLKAVHPSPLSAHRGFFGSKPFSQTNAFLIKMQKTPIDW